MLDRNSAGVDRWRGGCRRKVANIAPGATKLAGLSEKVFKKGIQKIIGEKGVFKDWGGESSDLMSSSLRFKGKKVRVAFAFKGPGQPGKLTIAKMGRTEIKGRGYLKKLQIFMSCSIGPKSIQCFIDSLKPLLSQNQ
jgi:hypothetical protein